MKTCVDLHLWKWTFVQSNMAPLLQSLCEYHSNTRVQGPDLLSRISCYLFILDNRVIVNVNLTLTFFNVFWFCFFCFVFCSLGDVYGL